VEVEEKSKIKESKSEDDYTWEDVESCIFSVPLNEINMEIKNRFEVLEIEDENQYTDKIERYVEIYNSDHEMYLPCPIYMKRKKKEK